MILNQVEIHIHTHIQQNPTCHIIPKTWFESSWPAAINSIISRALLVNANSNLYKQKIKWVEFDKQGTIPSSSTQNEARQVLEDLNFSLH